MTTTNKDFRVKNGLVVEGSFGTINGEYIVTEASLGTSLGDYIALSEKGNFEGVAALDIAKNVLTSHAVVFEGLTEDSYQTTLDTVDPTADRTITLPNVSGTVVTSGNINDAFPSQSGNNGKYLKTDGTNVSWATGGSGGGETLTIGTGLTGTSYDGSAPVTIAISSDVTTNTGSQTLTNKTISGSDNTISNIANSSLTNNSITINGTSVSLGGTRTLGSDDISEGSTNKYFTDERAQDAVGNSVGTGLTYNDSTGAISVTANTYDAYGSASTVAGDLTTHINDTSTHGVSGDIVGTSDTQTLTNKTLTSPKINEDAVLTATATELNTLDGITASTSELNILDGVTATTSEINTLDGITASTAELNILDGATLTVTELNYVDGVTSSIQDQLDDKANLASPTFTGMVTVDDLEIGGSLTFSGTATEITSTSLNIEDPLIYLADGNPGNINDLGFVANYNDGTYAHTGLVRDASANTWKLFKGVTDEPTNTVNFSQGSLDNLAVGTLTGNVTGNVTGDVSGNAGTVTNGVYTSGSYSDPSWITGLGWSKISSTPTTLSGYGITDAVADADFTTKGQILVATGSGTYTALNVGGTNGHVLTVDSAETSGIKWAAASGGSGGGGATLSNSMPTSPSDGAIWVDTDASVVDVSLYSAPTIGSTSIPSNTTVTTIAGLTLSSPDLTGAPTATTPGGGNNSTRVATTAYVQGELSSKAGTSAPTFTGTLTADVITASGAITGASLTLGTGTASSGHHNPQATNTYDLGTSSLRWRNIYTQDLHLSNGIGDYTVVEGEENLYLTNNKNGKSFKFALIEVDPSEVPAKSEV